jgi:hypothetical protein
VSLAEVFGVSRAVVRSALARSATRTSSSSDRTAARSSPRLDRGEPAGVRGALQPSRGDRREGRPDRLGAGRSDARKWVASEEAAYARGDERGGVRLSVDFHRQLAEIARNSVLSRYLDELVSRTPLIALAHRGQRPAPCRCDDHIASSGDCR